MWASQVLLVVKNLPANAGSIPESGRSPGEEYYPLQYSCLKNSIDRGGASWAKVHRVAKSQTWLKQLSMHTLENQTLIHLESKYPLNMVYIHGLGTYMVPVHSVGTYNYSCCCLLPFLLPCLFPINIGINYRISWCERNINNSAGVIMWLRVGLWRRLSAEELILLNCDVGEDSWDSLGLQGDPTNPS